MLNSLCKHYRTDIPDAFPILNLHLYIKYKHFMLSYKDMMISLVKRLTWAAAASLCLFNYLIVCVCAGTGAWTQGLHPESLHQPFFVIGFFRDRVLWTICLGWLCTVILLISASRVARITGMSHQCPVNYPNILLHLFSNSFLVGLQFELRALCLQSSLSITWASPPNNFALVILAMGFHKRFAWAGLKSWSSCFSLPNS
jgi:hypothetical protein